MNLERQSILWVDDQIELLRPHMLFLKEKGYRLTGVSNGDDALGIIETETVDLLLLDEQMPGKNGLETLAEVRKLRGDLPVIMITKSEDELLMNEALGHSVQDFLVKPVNPVQIFSAIKRIFERRRIQESQVTRDYIGEYNKLSTENMDDADWKRWLEVNRFLVGWDNRLDEFEGTGLDQTHQDLRSDMNQAFARFIDRQYGGWMTAAEDKRPALSQDVISRWVMPYVEAGRSVIFIVIDCMRLDQWLVIEPLLSTLFQIRMEEYFAILPTATPYARNAIFAGLLPAQIAKRYPQYWEEDPRQETSLNRYEKELLREQMKRRGIGDRQMKYAKISNISEANEIGRQIGSFRDIPLTALVFNFLDILAHGRSQSEILQEIAPDESAFRSLMGSWFRHSALFEMLKVLARQGSQVVITSDHGSILCRRSSLVHGNRATSAGLRYKYGDNLNCDTKQAKRLINPGDYQLPSDRSTKQYVIAREDHYFVYPTNFHKYEQRYRDSFQHGGISLEEMIVPCAILDPRP